jgi:DNA invertase Pin-like site-specific DNA recombinase
MGRRSKPANAGLAVAYIRVSTDDQALGPDAQRAAIGRWAANHGVVVVCEHADLGVSGGAELADRPGLMTALAALDANGAGLLLVAKRDRLARDVVVAAAVERLTQSKGARVVSADGTGNIEGPEGMLMRGLVDLFAQYELALIRSRTTAALAVKKSRGERVGAVPIGFRTGECGPLLCADPGEQAALARVVALRAEGQSVRAIAEQLNAEGVPARGRRWHPTTVARLLHRAA